jgi:hypothetical protein
VNTGTPAAAAGCRINVSGEIYTERKYLDDVEAPKPETRLSHTHASANLSLVDWQPGLRRQFGPEQAFGLENLTGEPEPSRGGHGMRSVRGSRRSGAVGDR